MYNHTHRVLTAFYNRNKFEADKLIYVPLGRDGQHKWHEVSGCIWSSKTRIGSKVTLEEHYANLKPFFVDFLGVRTLTLSMVYEELVRLGSLPDASIEDTMDHIMSLNSFLMETNPADYPSSSQLVDANILPIWEVDGTVSLASSKSDFVICDRTHLEKIFAAKFNELDFIFEDVCRLGPFIEYLGINKKRLSEAVIESTKVDPNDVQPLARADREIGPKAYSLYR